LHSPPGAGERLALLSAKAVGLEIAGVDLLESSAGPLLLEVNSSPGFQELEKSTGINVAEMMIKMCARKASNGRRRARRKKA